MAKEHLVVKLPYCFTEFMVFTDGSACVFMRSRVLLCWSVKG